MSKRTRQRCKGPSVQGDPNNKCRMHGGGLNPVGMAAHGAKTGRFSRYLPAHMEELFEEAMSNPDLLELGEYIALLETRIKDILATIFEGDTVPRWSELALLFGSLQTAILSGDAKTVMPALEELNKALEDGKRWDRAWDNIQETVENLRKVADTEIKRKKELNQMVPIERVVVLMAAVGTAVKRHVKNPEEIAAVFRELAMLSGSNKTAGGKERVHESVIEISPESRGSKGGRSHMAMWRKEKKAQRLQKALEEPSGATEA